VQRLRQYAVTRSLGDSASLQQAIDRMGFVQADPIRSPARAQDLILRHRVDGYRAGDLGRRYRGLEVEEDFFINYGFVAQRLYGLMHPRGRLGAWPAPGKRVGEAVLAYAREQGEVHPRQVDAHFAHGVVTNYWGGSSSATTRVLDHLHYRGLLRVAGRDGGIRVYEAHGRSTEPVPAPLGRAHVDALIDAVVALYAPVPSATLSWLVNRLGAAVPQWQADLPRAKARAQARLGHTTVDGVRWYWPTADDPRRSRDAAPAVRLLAPFDPVVWDRRRFTFFWDWEYRFEAYTPPAKRKLGYYAMPLLWRDQVVGWGNLSAANGRFEADVRYVAGAAPRDRGFAAALDAELEAMRVFLGV
jgi:hypothetical protein